MPSSPVDGRSPLDRGCERLPRSPARANFGGMGATLGLAPFVWVAHLRAAANSSGEEAANLPSAKGLVYAREAVAKVACSAAVGRGVLAPSRHALKHVPLSASVTLRGPMAHACGSISWMCCGPAASHGTRVRQHLLDVLRPGRLASRYLSVDPAPNLGRPGRGIVVADKLRKRCPLELRPRSRDGCSGGRRRRARRRGPACPQQHSNRKSNRSHPQRVARCWRLPHRRSRAGSLRCVAAKPLSTSGTCASPRYKLAFGASGHVCSP